MLTLMAISIGCLYAAATYMILRRSIVKLVIGLPPTYLFLLSPA